MTLRNRLGIFKRNLFASSDFDAPRRELHRLLSAAPEGPERWIDITEQYRGKGWFANMAAWQVRQEFEAMVTLVQQAAPARIMEIGTAKGATLLCWCRIASTQVISVDLEGGIHGGGYPTIKQLLYREFTCGRPGVRLDLFQDNSQVKATRQKVESVLGGEKLDVLFIDGDHSYTGVKTDFDLWSPLVRAGGLILFHDILPHTNVAHCEVDRLWNELRQHHRHTEFIHDSMQGWAGIGALYLDQATGDS
ncbi:MAG: class I SAM-dependent methyltransferase [Pirellulaceae bacterium]